MQATRTTLHEQIREQLIEELQDFSIEQRLPSDRQLAKRFGVALLTINKVMLSLQQDGYVDRIQGKGTILTSRERHIQVGGHNGQATMIVATPNYFSYEYWSRSYIADELARKNRCRTLDYRFGGTVGFEGLLELVRSADDPAGVLISPVPGTLTREVVEELDALGVPVVIFYTCQWVSSARNVFAIVPDWFQSGYLGTRRLLEAGRTRLAYIDNEPPEFGDQQAKNGIKQAMYERKLRLKDLIRPEPCCQAWGDSREAGYRMSVEALDAGADGLLCASLNGALGAYRACWERDLRIPQDISVVAGSGCEDPRTFNFMTPPLTTTEANLRWEMETAFDLIHARVSPISRLIVSEVRLHDRASVQSTP